MVELCERCGEVGNGQTCGCSAALPALELDLDRARPIPAAPSSASSVGARASTAWEWLSPNGETIVARIDAAEGMESVYVGQRLVSRSKLGAKPEGHAIAAKPGGEGYRRAAPTLVVTYDPVEGAFDLRANGQLVPPAARPPAFGSPPSLGPLSSPRGAAPIRALPPPPRTGMSPVTVAMILAGIALAVVVLGAGVVKALKPVEPPAGDMLASTGLVRLNYPLGFKPMKPKGPTPPSKGDPTQSSWLSATHAARDEGVFVLSVRMNGVSVGRDPWVVSNFLHKKFAKTMDDEKLFKQKATLTENSRTEEPCLGEPGAVVAATFRYGAESGTLWTCTFLHNGNAFMIGYYADQKLVSDEPTLREILDRTELLAD